MNNRTTRSRIAFASPFFLRGIDGEQKPGIYDVETEEAIIEGKLHTAFRWVATILYVSRDGTTTGYLVDPGELAAAHRADRETSSASPRAIGDDRRRG